MPNHAKKIQDADILYKKKFLSVKPIYWDILCIPYHIVHLKIEDEPL